MSQGLAERRILVLLVTRVNISMIDYTTFLFVKERALCHYKFGFTVFVT